MRKSMQGTLCGVAVILAVTVLASGNRPLRVEQAAQPVVASATTASPSAAYGKLPLYFEQNRGQADAAVQYLSRGPGHTLYLSANEQRMQLRGTQNDAAASLRISLAGARPAPAMAGEQLREGKSHYLNRSPAITNVPHYSRVRYREVYEGIDLVFYGNPQQLEYDFIVAPGSDPQDIRLAYQGAESARINDRGDLELALAGGTVVQKKPLVYQEVDGERVEIESRYTQPAPMEVAFALGDYDQSRPLVIDPVLVYSTYLGGSGGGDELAYAIAVDSSGSAYVAGTTVSGDFPTVAGSAQTSPGFFQDFFITKLNPTGDELVYSTFLGGSADDYARAIVVDSSGSAHVAGYTAPTTNQPSNFPVVGGIEAPPGGLNRRDAVIAKLSPAGDALIYSTRLGGSQNDEAYGIALDDDGNVYVTGHSESANFPVVGGTQATKNSVDTFVTKLNPAGNALIYSTFLGRGSIAKFGKAIAVDGSGNAYAVGIASGTTNVAVIGGGGSGDAYVAKLNPAGDALLYYSEFGGDNNDFGEAVAVDGGGSAYVVGRTASDNFPVVGGVQSTRFNAPSGTDPFITKLNPAGDALAYSTYLGARGGVVGAAVAVDGVGNAYVTGAGFGEPSKAVEAFVAKLNPMGNRLLSYSFLGGGTNANGQQADEYSYGIALDASGNVYVAGQTSSSDFPVVSPAQTTFGGGFDDAFVSKLVVTDDAPGGGGNGDPDTTPDGFSFVDQNGQANCVSVGVVVQSNTITVAGINAPAAISVVGGEYRIGNGAFTLAAGTVSNGDTVQLRHTSAATQGATTNTTLTIGGVSDTFTSSTCGAGNTTPDDFSFVDQNGQANCVSVGVVVQSNTITVAGINAPAAISVVGGEYRIGSGAFTSAAGTVSNGDTVQLRHTSAATQGATTNTTLTIGGVSDTFTSSTCGAGTTTPVGSCPANDRPVFETTSQPLAEFDAELAYTLRVRSPTGGNITVNVRGLPSCISLLSNGLDPNSYSLSGLVDVGCAAGSFDIQLRALSESGCGTDLLLPISLLNGEREVLTDFLGRLVRMVTNLGELEDLRSISAATQPVATLPGFSYPQGFFSGRIDDTAAKASGASQAKLAVGGAANVSFSIGADGANAFVSCDARFCQELPLLSSSASALSVQLQDGGAGDIDGRADGIITFNGAPALKSASAAVGQRSDGSSGGAFGALWMLLLLCSLRLMHGAWAQRRRAVVA